MNAASLVVQAPPYKKNVKFWIFKLLAYTLCDAHLENSPEVPYFHLKKEKRRRESVTYFTNGLFSTINLSQSGILHENLGKDCNLILKPKGKKERRKERELGNLVFLRTADGICINKNR